MELWTGIMKDTSCIVCGSSRGICCNCWRVLYTARFCFCRTPVCQEICAVFHFLCKLSCLCGSLVIASLFFFLSVLDGFHKMCFEPQYTHCARSKYTFICVCMYMKITKSAFPIQHPDRAMILPCLQSLEGKEGKETSWSILAVKLLGTDCANQAGLTTLSIRGGHLRGL